MKSSVTGREGDGMLGPQIRTQPQTRWVREGPSTQRTESSSSASVQDCPSLAWAPFPNLRTPHMFQEAPAKSSCLLPNRPTFLLLNFSFFHSSLSLDYPRSSPLQGSPQEPQKHHPLPEAFPGFWICTYSLSLFTARICFFVVYWSALDTSLC